MRPAPLTVQRVFARPGLVPVGTLTLTAAVTSPVSVAPAAGPVTQTLTSYAPVVAELVWQVGDAADAEAPTEATIPTTSTSAWAARMILVGFTTSLSGHWGRRTVARVSAAPHGKAEQQTDQAGRDDQSSPGGDASAP